MSTFGPQRSPARYHTCESCGSTYPTAEKHECELGKRLDFQMQKLAGEVASFDSQLTSWLGTEQGRAAVYFAEREHADRLVEKYDVRIDPTYQPS